MYTVLTDLAEGVAGIVKGDIAVVMAAGFEATKEGKAVTSLSTPLNLKAINKIEGGVVYVSWDKVENKAVYKCALSGQIRDCEQNFRLRFQSRHC